MSNMGNIGSSCHRSEKFIRNDGSRIKEYEEESTSEEEPRRSAGKNRQQRRLDEVAKAHPPWASRKSAHTNLRSRKLELRQKKSKLKKEHDEKLMDRESHGDSYNHRKNYHEYIQATTDYYAQLNKGYKEELDWLRGENARRQECIDEAVRAAQQFQPNIDWIESETSKRVSEAAQQSSRMTGFQAKMDQISARQNKVVAGDFAVLGLKPGSSVKEIKRARRDLFLAVHPDRHPLATELEKEEYEREFQKGVDAYDRLMRTHNHT